MWLYLSNLQAVQNELEDLQPRTNVKHLNQHQHSDAAVDFWTLWYCLKLMTQQTQKQALRRNNFARVSMKKSDTYKDKVQKHIGPENNQQLPKWSHFNTRHSPTNCHFFYSARAAIDYTQLLFQNGRLLQSLCMENCDSCWDSDMYLPVSTQ